MTRHSSFVIRHSRLLLLAAAVAALAGCYEQKQSVILNPDGSGKVFVVTDVAVPNLGAPGKEKPTAISFGRQMAADLINKTRGVETWADVAVSQAADGRAHIEATAYFKDINALKFDMPIVFQWDRDIDGATLSIQRERKDVATPAALSDADIQKLVATTKQDYDEHRLALRTQLTGFKLTLVFQLPGALDGEHLLAHEGNSVTFVIDGKKAADALDKVMTDDAALTATFKRGKDTSDNDDIMLQSMYGASGPVKVHSTFKLNAPPLFDYRTEKTVASLREAQMLKDAGIDLLPKFIVKDATTAPATNPGH